MGAVSEAHLHPERQGPSIPSVTDGNPGSTTLTGTPRIVEERVDAVGHPAFAVDSSNCVVSWNPAATDLLGIEGANAIGKALVQVLEARDPFGNRWCPDNCGLHAMARRGESANGFTLEMQSASGEPVVSVEVLREPADSDYHLFFTLLPDRRRRDVFYDGFNERRSERRPVDPADRDTRAVELTHRQVEVLRLLGQGKSTQEVATTLGISLNTVRNHIQNSLSKMGARSQAHAVAVAIRRRLI
jgi:DNA-binding CsgD family transcriptional regulator